MKVNTLSDIFTNFTNEPVEISQLVNLYVSAVKGRGDNPTKEMQLRLEYSTKPIKILFAGYRGCGKSTELNKLQFEIQTKFSVLNYSIMEESDPINLTYIELFIITMEKLFELAEKEHFDIRKEYIDSIKGWLSSKEIQEIRDSYIGLDSELGSETQFSIPWLQKFFFKLKIAGKTSKNFKEILKQNVEPRLSELIFHCNTLIEEIRIAGRKRGFKDVLIIVEDLDKIPIDRAESLFFNYASQLTQLQASVIFTFPITLLYNQKFNIIRQYFDYDFELPMIKVNNKDGSSNAEGRDILRTIVERRMDLALFAKPENLETLIGYSGGCLRDLFRMILESASNALISENDKIEETDIQKGILRLKNDYSNTISDNRKADKTFISAKQYFETLVAVVNDVSKHPENTEALLDLRQNLCVLGYNSENWCDVHPLVKDILKDRGLLS
ncbi:MAG: hypothetical protein JNL70_01000 [Saprospiraceae bacterium]|nr:hypothetical protein [Saprospiraceae bacterium]